jgi:hypothetical protein
MRKTNLTFQQVKRLKELRTAIRAGHDVVEAHERIRSKAESLARAEALLLANCLEEASQITGTKYQEWLHAEIHCAKLTSQHTTRYIRLARDR